MLPRSRIVQSTLVRRSVLPAASLLLPLIPHRFSAHASESRANGPKNSPGARLGAKRGHLEYVVPGNIIFRQRGSLWFPGENCEMGKDFTIYSKVAGYVQYYRDPTAGKGRRRDGGIALGRKMIGVSFERNDTLPYNKLGARKRRVGMYAVPRETKDETLETLGDMAVEDGQAALDRLAREALAAKSRRGKRGKSAYTDREANWEIGRVRETVARQKEEKQRMKRMRKMSREKK